MKTVWVIQTAYRRMEPQLQELTRLSEGSSPQEIWVLGGAGTVLPSLHLPAPCRLLQTESINPDSWLQILEQAVTEFAPQLLLFGSGEAGESVAVRLAYRLGGSALTGCVAVTCNEQDICLVHKKVYGGYLQATLQISVLPACLSAEQDPATATETTEDLPPIELIWQSNDIVMRQEPVCEQLVQPAGLAGARRLVGVGMGIGGPAGVQLAEKLAQRLQAVPGASRPVVMNGWLPMTQLLGVSGEVAAPEVSLLLGVSGAPAFWAGVERSKQIIAVNSDPAAPCLRCADVGVVTDCYAFTQALYTLLEQYQSGG